eukprot:m.123910 g.123910  ORF g.123910 m.123910 type:complete len:86 (+) comp37843_c0_seq9:723-980(+)
MDSGELDSDEIAILPRDEEPKMNINEPVNGLLHSQSPPQKGTPLTHLEILLIATYMKDASIGRPSHFKASEKELRKACLPRLFHC